MEKRVDLSTKQCKTALTVVEPKNDVVLLAVKPHVSDLSEVKTAQGVSPLLKMAFASPVIQIMIVQLEVSRARAT